MSKNTKSEQIVRSYRAVTILGQYPDYRHVQIVLKLLKSPGEVLLGFDVDCCTGVFTPSSAISILMTVWQLVSMVRGFGQQSAF